MFLTRRRFLVGVSSLLAQRQTARAGGSLPILGAGSGIASQIEWIVGTRGLISSGESVSGSWTRLEGRRQFRTGIVAMAKLKFRFYNGFLQQSGATYGEVPATSNMTLESMFLERGATTLEAKQVTFNGGASGFTLLPGEIVDSDWILPSVFTAMASFGANTTWWQQTNFTKGASDLWLNGYQNSISTEAQMGSTAAATQIGGTGAFTLPPGGATVGGIPVTIATIGTPVSARDIAGVIIGDSIDNADSATDNGTTTGGGIHVRAFRSTSLGRTANAHVPYSRANRSSDKSTGWALNATSAKARKGLMENATFITEGYGHNDLQGGATVAATLANKQAIWAYARAVGVKTIVVRPMFAFSSSSDAWATAANQTASAVSQSGGAHDQLDAAVLALVGQPNGPDIFMESVRDALITRNGSNHRVWKDGSLTADGLHPVNAGVTLAAAAEDDFIATLTP